MAFALLRNGSDLPPETFLPSTDVHSFATPFFDRSAAEKAHGSRAVAVCRRISRNKSTLITVIYN
jgi:hypothetical protein